jgi:hypothetical protein
MRGKKKSLKLPEKGIKRHNFVLHCNVRRNKKIFPPKKLFCSICQIPKKQFFLFSLLFNTRVLHLLEISTKLRFFGILCRQFQRKVFSSPYGAVLIFLEDKRPNKIETGLDCVGTVFSLNRSI